MSEDLFKIDGLPEDVIKELGLEKEVSFLDKLKELFKIAGHPLSTRKIQIAFYKKHNEIIKYSSLTAKLGKLANDKLLTKRKIQRVRRGVYYLLDEDKPKKRNGHGGFNV